MERLWGPGRSQRVTTPHCSCGTTQISRAWGAPPTDSVLEPELDTPQSQVKGGWLLLVCHFLDALQTYFDNSWLLRMKASRVTQLVDDYYAMGVVSCIKLFIPKTCRKLASFWVTSFLTHSDVTALVACLYRLGILPKTTGFNKIHPCLFSQQGDSHPTLVPNLNK